MIRPASIMDLLVLIFNFDSDIKVNNLHAKVGVDKEVVRLDVPVRDTVFVKVCEAVDEAITELSDLVRRFMRS
jgi:hypothetical protein